jgi:hypothetical protein
MVPACCLFQKDPRESRRAVDENTPSYLVFAALVVLLFDLARGCAAS